jgi:chromosome segregation ATPase
MVAAILYDGQWKKLTGSSVEALLEEERRRSALDSVQFDAMARDAAAIQVALGLDQDLMESQRSKKEAEELRAVEMEAAQREAVESQAILSANDVEAQKEATAWMHMMIEELAEEKRMLDMRAVTLEKRVRDLEMEMREQEETKAELHERLRKEQSTSFTLTGPELEDNKRSQNAIQTKLDELEEVAQLLVGGLNELMQELKKIRRSCEDVFDQIEDLKRQVRSAQSEPSGLHSTSSTDPTSSSTASFAPSNTQTTSLLTSSFAQHDQDLDQLQALIAAYEQQLAKTQAARDSKKRSVAALSPELDDLREVLEEEMMKKSKLATKLDSLASGSDSEVASLQREMKRSCALIQSLQEKLNELELVRDELLKELENLENLEHNYNNVVTQLLKDRSDLENLIERQHSRESSVSLPSPSTVGVEAPLRKLSISEINAQVQSDGLAARRTVESIEEANVLRAAMVAREEAIRAEEEAIARKAIEARKFEAEQREMSERRMALQAKQEAMDLALERRRAEMEAMLEVERRRREEDEERAYIARSVEQELDERRRREHVEMEQMRRLGMERERLMLEVAAVREAMNRAQGNLSQEQKERFNS